MGVSIDSVLLDREDMHTLGGPGRRVQQPGPTTLPRRWHVGLMEHGAARRSRSDRTAPTDRCHRFPSLLATTVRLGQSEEDGDCHDRSRVTMVYHRLPQQSEQRSTVGGMVEGQYRPEMSDCTGQRLGYPNVQTHGAPRGIPRVRLRT
jgi:hypothetical protein